jgi:hypothetical protein
MVSSFQNLKKTDNQVRPVKIFTGKCLARTELGQKPEFTTVSLVLVTTTLPKKCWIVVKDNSVVRLRRTHIVGQFGSQVKVYSCC